MMGKVIVYKDHYNLSKSLDGFLYDIKNFHVVEIEKEKILDPKNIIIWVLDNVDYDVHAYGYTKKICHYTYKEFEDREQDLIDLNGNGGRDNAVMENMNEWSREKTTWTPTYNFYFLKEDDAALFKLSCG